MGTFVVLGTILGVPSIALRPELEPLVGTFLANVWGPGLALAYCVWQFRKQRCLRRAAWESDAVESGADSQIGVDSLAIVPHD